MKCPFCANDDTRVLDSRLADGGETVRRRRRCEACDERFTTYERVEMEMPRVIKSNGERESFSEDKLRAGLYRALEKRPVEANDVEAAVGRVLKAVASSGEREMPTKRIGDYVMRELRELDEVAYVRFASVYRRFQDIEAFSDEIRRLRESIEKK